MTSERCIELQMELPADYSTRGPSWPLGWLGAPLREADEQAASEQGPHLRSGGRTRRRRRTIRITTTNGSFSLPLTLSTFWSHRSTSKGASLPRLARNLGLLLALVGLLVGPQLLVAGQPQQESAENSLAQTQAPAELQQQTIQAGQESLEGPNSSSSSNSNSNSNFNSNFNSKETANSEQSAANADTQQQFDNQIQQTKESSPATSGQSNEQQAAGVQAADQPEQAAQTAPVQAGEVAGSTGAPANEPPEAVQTTLRVELPARGEEQQGQQAAQEAQQPEEGALGADVQQQQPSVGEQPEGEGAPLVQQNEAQQQQQQEIADAIDQSMGFAPVQSGDEQQAFGAKRPAGGAHWAQSSGRAAQRQAGEQRAGGARQSARAGNPHTLKRANGPHMGVFGRKTTPTPHPQTVAGQEELASGAGTGAGNGSGGAAKHQHHHYYYRTTPGEQERSQSATSSRPSKQGRQAGRSAGGQRGGSARAAKLRPAEFPDYREILVEPEHSERPIELEVLRNEQQPRQQRVGDPLGLPAAELQVEQQQQSLDELHLEQDKLGDSELAGSGEQTLGASGTSGTSGASGGVAGEQQQQPEEQEQQAGGNEQQQQQEKAGESAGQQQQPGGPYIRLSNVATLNGSALGLGASSGAQSQQQSGGGEMKLMRIYVIDLDQKLVVGNGPYAAEQQATTGVTSSTPAPTYAPPTGAARPAGEQAATEEPEQQAETRHTVYQAEQATTRAMPTGQYAAAAPQQQQQQQVAEHAGHSAEQQPPTPEQTHAAQAHQQPAGPQPVYGGAPTAPAAVAVPVQVAPAAPQVVVYDNHSHHHELGPGQNYSHNHNYQNQNQNLNQNLNQNQNQNLEQQRQSAGEQAAGYHGVLVVDSPQSANLSQMLVQAVHAQYDQQHQQQQYSQQQQPMQQQQQPMQQQQQPMQQQQMQQYPQQQQQYPQQQQQQQQIQQQMQYPPQQQQEQQYHEHGPPSSLNSSLALFLGPKHYVSHTAETAAPYGLNGSSLAGGHSNASASSQITYGGHTEYSVAYPHLVVMQQAQQQTQPQTQPLAVHTSPYKQAHYEQHSSSQQSGGQIQAAAVPLYMAPQYANNSAPSAPQAQAQAQPQVQVQVQVQSHSHADQQQQAAGGYPAANYSALAGAQLVHHQANQSARGQPESGAGESAAFAYEWQAPVAISGVYSAGHATSGENQWRPVDLAAAAQPLGWRPSTGQQSQQQQHHAQYARPVQVLAQQQQAEPHAQPHPMHERPAPMVYPPTADHDVVSVAAGGQRAKHAQTNASSEAPNHHGSVPKWYANGAAEQPPKSPYKQQAHPAFEAPDQYNGTSAQGAKQLAALEAPRIPGGQRARPAGQQYTSTVGQQYASTVAVEVEEQAQGEPAGQEQEEPSAAAVYEGAADEPEAPPADEYHPKARPPSSAQAAHPPARPARRPQTAAARPKGAKGAASARPQQRPLAAPQLIQQQQQQQQLELADAYVEPEPLGGPPMAGGYQLEASSYAGSGGGGGSGAKLQYAALESGPQVYGPNGGSVRLTHMRQPAGGQQQQQLVYQTQQQQPAQQPLAFYRPPSAKGLLSWETLSSVASGAAKRLPGALSSIFGVGQQTHGAPKGAPAYPTVQSAAGQYYQLAGLRGASQQQQQQQQLVHFLPAGQYAKSAHYDRDVSNFHRPYPLRHMSNPEAYSDSPRPSPDEQTGAHEPTDEQQADQPAEPQPDDDLNSSSSSDSASPSGSISASASGSVSAQVEAAKQPALNATELVADLAEIGPEHEKGPAKQQAASKGAKAAKSRAKGAPTSAEQAPLPAKLGAGKQAAVVQPKKRRSKKPAAPKGVSQAAAAAANQKEIEQLAATTLMDPAVLSAAQASGQPLSLDQLPLAEQQKLLAVASKHAAKLAASVQPPAGMAPPMSKLGQQSLAPVGPTGMMFEAPASEQQQQLLAGQLGQRQPQTLPGNGGPTSLQIGHYKITPQTQFVQSIIEPSRQMLGQYFKQYIGQLGQFG